MRLYDRDLFVIDDRLSETLTDRQGRFELAGNTDEITRIRPSVAIYHDCNDGFRRCQRTFSIDIPDAYITDGPTPSRVFDVGTIELEARRSDESRVCVS
ncbi:hypothetical protein SF23_15955 [Streptomyces sp. MBRL 10]|nr:hypothetical protein SF23_15955 [Streptomyces sp. MBRL 10]